MASPFGFKPLTSAHRSQLESGFSLIELLLTLTVMTILTAGVLPLAQVGVKRQHEQRLRETLREIRTAIDEFHRDTAGVQCIGAASSSRPPGVAAPPDLRSRVIIADCTIFGVDNPDRYPPDLETLVNGVNVVARTTLVSGGGPSGPNATEVNNLATKRKVYLRSMPIDPLTGKSDWLLRSCYDASDATSWGQENVFDVRSAAKGTALNGEK